MVATTAGRSSAQDNAGPPARTKRRLSRVLFGFLQSTTAAGEAHTPARSLEFADDQLGRHIAEALSLRQAYYTLPADLALVPDRLNFTATIRAAGFSDSRSKSIGVDVASWLEPLSETLDDIAWRRVFTWIVGTDSRLTNISILAPPAQRRGRIVGSYGYNADGIPGYGVLQVAATEDGCWQICDCWGDAVEADRVDAISGFATPS